METDPKSFPDPSQQMAEAVSSIARSLDVSTQLLQRIDGKQESFLQFLAYMAGTARWHFWLLVLVLLASVGMFVVGVRTHAVQSEALRQVMQENRAIFERLSR